MEGRTLKHMNGSADTSKPQTMHMIWSLRFIGRWLCSQ